MWKGLKYITEKIKLLRFWGISIKIGQHFATSRFVRIIDYSGEYEHPNKFWVSTLRKLIPKDDILNCYRAILERALTYLQTLKYERTRGDTNRL